jgi:lysophospholipase L1-like esterase
LIAADEAATGQAKAPDVASLSPTSAPLVQPLTTIPADNHISRASGWYDSCVKRVKAAQGQPVDILMVGDSITQNFIEEPTDKWKCVGKEVWDKSFAGRNVLNFGVGSDGTEHVLWRLEKIDLTSFSPKVVVVEIGVNDMKYPAADIAAGTRAVLDKCQALFPKARIILMAILPNHRNWDRTREVNALTRAFVDNQRIFSLDLTEAMPLEKGNFKGMGPDHLHPLPEGYEIWASRLLPLIDQLLAMP